MSSDDEDRPPKQLLRPVFHFQPPQSNLTSSTMTSTNYKELYLFHLTRYCKLYWEKLQISLDHYDNEFFIVRNFDFITNLIDYYSNDLFVQHILHKNNKNVFFRHTQSM
jgi:hypothetical protein